MTHRNKLLAAMIALVAVALSATSSARSIRVDSGDWDVSGFLSGSSTESLGFSFDALGLSTSQITLDANGRATLQSGGDTVSFNPFYDLTQSQGGNTALFSFGVTNANFSQAGIDAGFRATWLIQDSLGAILNEFQFSLFALSSGMFAVEFNYNQLTLGTDATSNVGFDSTLAGTFDLLANLGLTVPDALGIGNDEFTTNCPNNPNALACNNYFDGTYGPDASVLAGVLGGYFSVIDTNGGQAQGRALFLFAGNGAQVPAPGTLALVALGLFALRRMYKG